MARYCIHHHQMWSYHWECVWSQQHQVALARILGQSARCQISCMSSCLVHTSRVSRQMSTVLNSWVTDSCDIVSQMSHLQCHETLAFSFIAVFCDDHECLLYYQMSLEFSGMLKCSLILSTSSIQNSLYKLVCSRELKPKNCKENLLKVERRTVVLENTYLHPWKSLAPASFQKVEKSLYLSC